jgi:hypothetical protein
MAHEQGAMTGVERRKKQRQRDFDLDINGRGTSWAWADAGAGVWNGGRQPSPNRMLARSLAPLTKDPCLALDKAGAAQVQKRTAEDRNK